MARSLLTIGIVLNMLSAYGQCFYSTFESDDKKILFGKVWGERIKKDKREIEINLVRIDTLHNHAKRSYYLTVVVDSLGNEVINSFDQLTLRIEHQKPITIEPKTIELPEFATIFYKNERFFQITTATLEEIASGHVLEIQISSRKIKESIIRRVDKKQFTIWISCIKEAW
jgi:hypothetical protein